MHPIHDCHHATPHEGCTGLSCERFRRAFAQCERVIVRVERRASPRAAELAHLRFLKQLRESAARMITR